MSSGRKKKHGQTEKDWQNLLKNAAELDGCGIPKTDPIMTTSCCARSKHGKRCHCRGGSKKRTSSRGNKVNECVSELVSAAADGLIRSISRGLSGGGGGSTHQPSTSSTPSNHHHRTAGAPGPVLRRPRHPPMPQIPTNHHHPVGAPPLLQKFYIVAPPPSPRRLPQPQCPPRSPPPPGAWAPGAAGGPSTTLLPRHQHIPPLPPPMRLPPGNPTPYPTAGHPQQHMRQQQEQQQQHQPAKPMYEYSNSGGEANPHHHHHHSSDNNIYEVVHAGPSGHFGSSSSSHSSVGGGGGGGGVRMPMVRHLSPTADQPMIVTFQTSVPDKTREEICSSFRDEHLINIQSTFRHCLKGFAAQVAQNKLSHISSHPHIRRIEPDYTVHTWAQIIPWGVKRVNAPVAALWPNQKNPLDDAAGGGGKKTKKQRRGPDNPAPAAAAEPAALAGQHRTGGGEGRSSATAPRTIDCDIFIIDTGISRHPDLNVVEMRNFALGEAWSDADQCGHGTHVAGTAAACDRGTGIVGVAPGARLHGLKALDTTGSGQMSWVIAAIDYISETKLRNPSKPIVANLSLGFYSGNSSYNALDDAISRCVASGVTFIVAAGNDAVDASMCSPAHVQGAITVGAYNQKSKFADFSNFGNTVDISAPGVDIYSAWVNNGYQTLSGTSMAAPHATGAAACFLATNPTAPPEVVKNAILRAAQNTVHGTPNSTSVMSLYLTPSLLDERLPPFALPGRPLPLDGSNDDTAWNESDTQPPPSLPFYPVPAPQQPPPPLPPAFLAPRVARPRTPTHSYPRPPPPAPPPAPVPFPVDRFHHQPQPSASPGGYNRQVTTTPKRNSRRSQQYPSRGIAGQHAPKVNHEDGGDADGDNHDNDDEGAYSSDDGHNVVPAPPSLPLPAPRTKSRVRHTAPPPRTSYSNNGYAPSSPPANNYFASVPVTAPRVGGQAPSAPLAPPLSPRQPFAPPPLPPPPIIVRDLRPPTPTPQPTPSDDRSKLLQIIARQQQRDPRLQQSQQDLAPPRPSSLGQHDGDNSDDDNDDDNGDDGDDDNNNNNNDDENGNHQPPQPSTTLNLGAGLMSNPRVRAEADGQVLSHQALSLPDDKGTTPPLELGSFSLNFS